MPTGGEVYMWGYGYYGQIGDGGVANRRNPTLIRFGGQLISSIDLGDFHSAALTAGVPCDRLSCAV